MKYTFIVEQTISMWSEVEAETIEDAVKIAQQRTVQKLCTQCSHGGPNSWNMGEVDCEDPISGALVDLHTDGDLDPNLFEVAEELWEAGR